ncbi:MAG: tetratricopeptide repeat protein [Cytophagales bacterium]|nr:tetratricopeptide repeat protein [Cytophagales bacterium]
MPRQPYFLNNRGFIYLSMNDYEKAEQDINDSIGLDPYNAWAYRNKGILYLIRKDYKSAERLLKQALEYGSLC